MTQFFNPNLQSTPKPKAYSDVIGLLNDFCRDVKEVTNGQVTCALVPGFVTGFGQEWKVTAHSVQKNIDHILFRAYVPADGVPTRLDFYEDQMTECATPDEVKRALQSFARGPVAEETLQTLS
jgi:hypothetical protein